MEGIEAPHQMERFYRLDLPGLGFDQIEASPFDLAYRLRSELNAASVEPDFAVEFYHGYDATARDSAQSETRSFPPGCWDADDWGQDRTWAISRIEAPEAWAYSANLGRPEGGRGVLIAQPDTGIRREHVELAEMFDMKRSKNTLEGGKDVRDPLDHGFLLHPGHGTSTSSVAVSRKGDEVTGSAPAAKIAPIRAINSVILGEAFQGNIVSATEHARRTKCHVISMSFGGLPSLATWWAIQRAVKADLLVMAAAGNCVKIVVFPAAFSNCIAVAGTNPQDQMWKGSSRGSSVDVAAPVSQVWRAFKERPDGLNTSVKVGKGMSFAVAVVAGVAALWLAHWGRTKLVRDENTATLQERFRHLLRKSAVPAEDWDFSNMGTGIVKAERLLQERINQTVPKSARLPSKLPKMPGLAADILRQIFGTAAGRADAPALGLTRGEYDAVALELIWLAMKRQQEAVFQMDDSTISHRLGALPGRPSEVLMEIAKKRKNPLLHKIITPRSLLH